VIGGDLSPAVPGEVLARIGSSPRELSRLGSSRVLAGNNLILKVGPSDRSAREAFVLNHLGNSRQLAVPSLVDAGSGWLLLRAIDVVQPRDPARWRARAVADLAGLHEAFAGVAVTVTNDMRLRDITGRELPVLAERCAGLAARLGVPEPLRVLAADLAPLLSELTRENTFVHGDAWPGNVLSTRAGGRCWIDWEEAGTGHAALDLANWLHGSPWVPPSPEPAGDLAVYLAARTSPIDPAEFRRAVDAAVVLLFLLLDLPGLAERDEEDRRDITERRALMARQFLH